jgi:N-acetylmuramoyl-L-alanine amidase
MPWTNEQARDRVIRTLLGESNGTPEGMISVAHVIKNRADSGAWGDPTKGGLTQTITAPKQFSMWNTDDPKLRALAAGVSAIPTTDPRYQRAGAIVDGVFGNDIPDPTGGATHYHTTFVSPEWSQGATPTATIGGHYFYKLPLTASNTAGTAVTGPSSVGMGASAAPAAPATPPLTALGNDKPAGQQAVTAALANAKSMLGKNEVPDHDELMQYLHDGGQDLDPHKLAWCAAFVSASLQKAGLPVPTQVVKDSAFGGGALAGNYKTYGSAVDPTAIQAGDILVANDGSHVGFAEGPVRQGPNGPEVQMIAGNEKDTSGQYAPGSYTNPATGAVANRAQVGMVGERWVPVSQYTARRYEPAEQTGQQQQAPPVASAAAPASSAAAPAPSEAAPAPAATSSPSAGFVGPGSDKYSVVSGMTSGTGRNPQLTTAANWGNLFGGGSPAPPASAPAATAPSSQPVPDLTQRVPLDKTPLPPVRPTDLAPPTASSSAPLSSILPNWGATTPANPDTLPNTGGVPGGGVTGRAPMTAGAPSMGFPAMTNPFGQPPDQVSQLPGSMLSSAQNLIKLLFPSNVG